MKPKLRFKEFSDEYVLSDLGKYLIQYKKTTNSNNQYPVLTSSRSGIFFQEDYFNRQVASKDNTGYNIVPRNYFTYRHMSDDTIFSFNINTLCDYGIVSTLYPVFTTNTEMNSNYLKEYLNNSKRFSEYCLLQKQGGSRTYMYFDKLKKFVGCFPSIQEQTKVSNFLSLIDKKIDLQSKKIEDLKLFKKGLLNVISKEITESKTIKEICEYKNGNSYEEYVCDEGKYNLISLNSVDINGNLKNDMKKIKLSNPDTLIKNDIVMVLSDVAHGDFLGVSALIDEDNKYVLNQRMGLLRIMDNSIPQFIVEMINNEQRKFKILGQGSSQLNLSKDDILNQKIKYPCIISQKKYATIFNNINTGLKLNKEKLIKLQELKKGLMQNMFV